MKSVAMPTTSRADTNTMPRKYHGVTVGLTMGTDGYLPSDKALSSRSQPASSWASETREPSRVVSATTSTSRCLSVSLRPRRIGHLRSVPTA